jgi:deazaflavin-dependent oxidoreductase (nitroreductase family)
MPEWFDKPNPVQRGVRRLIAARPIAWGLSHSIHHLDRVVLRLSDGRMAAGTLLTGLPIIALTTVGARSGRPRTVPLIGIPDGDRLILIASNWGQEKHPAWYHNLKAYPRVTATFRGRAEEYLAREVAGEEREACWRRAVALYPGYRDYARRTERTIPVIILE